MLGGASRKVSIMIVCAKVGKQYFAFILRFKRVEILWNHIRDKTLALAFALSLLAFSIFALALGRVVVLILAL